MARDQFERPGVSALLLTSSIRTIRSQAYKQRLKARIRLRHKSTSTSRKPQALQTTRRPSRTLQKNQRPNCTFRRASSRTRPITAIPLNLVRGLIRQSALFQVKTAVKQAPPPVKQTRPAVSRRYTVEDRSDQLSLDLRISTFH
jgi:hypothetical protein